MTSRHPGVAGRYPDFELADPAAVTWSGGQVRGPRALPVTVEPVRIG